ncbi:unnamed protein product, partial [Nesidiocoris tenuis]
MLALKRKDILVIATLWSLEIVYTLSESWKLSFLVEDPEEANQGETPPRKISYLVSNDVMRIVLLVLAFLTIVAVAILADGRRKFGYLLGGLSIYFFTPVIGLMANNFNAPGLIDVLFLLEFGWASVSSLRYWIIFHQRFPLSVMHTRGIVTCGELAIGATEYTMTAWVSPTKFGPLVYNAAWSITLVLMLIWLGMVWVVKPSVNNVEDKKDAVQRVYEESELLDSFDARQMPYHAVLFSCLIFSTMMMSSHKAAVSFIFKLMRNDLPEFAQYRIDLVIALLCLAVVTGIWIALSVVRHEIRDLLVIGIAYLLNILACLVFLLLIVRVSPVKKTTPLRFPYGAVLTFIIYPGYNGMQLNHHNPREHYVGYSSPMVTTLPAKVGSTIWLSGYYPNETQIFDTNITANRNEGYYVQNQKLARVKGFGGFFKPMPTHGPRLVLFISGLLPCNNGSQSDDNGTRCIFNGGCHSVRISLKTPDMENGKPDILPEQKLDVPLLGEVQKLVIDSNRSFTYHIEYAVDGQKLIPHRSFTTHSLKDKQDDHPFTIISTNIAEDDYGVFLNRTLDILP